jgi:hypothetical protein
MVNTVNRFWWQALACLFPQYPHLEHDQMVEFVNHALQDR